MTVSLTKVVPTVILVWSDGDVSTGLASLRTALTAAAYGYDDGPFSLVANVEGTLLPVTMTRINSGWDADDFSYPRYVLALPNRAPFASLTLRIDGRS